MFPDSTDLERLPAAALTEGDVNLSPQRAAFQPRHLGPETRRLLAEDAEWFLHQSLSTPCLNALDRARGSFLVDVDGREILDFHGNSVHQVGYGHPRVVAAIREQLDVIPFCPRRYANRPAIELARRLCQMAPVRRAAGSDAVAHPRILLAPGGAEAIGMALKLARYATGRFKTVSMWDSFHGASLDAISIGGEALFRKGAGPLLPGCLHIPPYASEGVGRDSADYLDYVLSKEPDVGAVVAEPMRWTTVVPPPSGYWRQIRAACDRHGALLVIDEIPSCLGRTGKMFCCEHFDLEPDILVIGKGLGGGVFPMAAIVARGDLNIAGRRALGHFTHEKSSIGSAAALATLDVLAEERLVDRAADLGRQTLNRLRSQFASNALVHEVRGLGLQLAVELRREGRPATTESDAALYGALERGLSFKISDGNVLSLCPPLTITDDEMTRAVEILTASIDEASAGTPRENQRA